MIKRYEKYKPSGIEWVGEIPEKWSLKKVSYSFKKIGSGTTPTAGNQDYYLNGEYNWLQTGDLTNGVINSTSKKITKKALEDFSTLRFYAPGSIVIAMYGATIGKVGLLSIETTTNQACCVLSESEVFISKYVFYWFTANKANIISLSYGGGQPNISQDIIKSLRIPLPSATEQNAIVNYLDKKTKLIDAFIAKKQKLIELLNEEMAIIINQAVNGKGENWERKKLKYIAQIKYGLGQPPQQKDDGLPLIRATNVKRGRISEEDLIFVDPDDIPYERDPVLKENDIIIVRSGAYTADSAIIPKKYEGAITGYDMVVRVVKDNPLFISFCLLSNDVLVNQLYLHRLRAAQPHLNKEELGETLLHMPALKEQEEIVQHIQIKLQEIENTIGRIEKENDLMREYKVSLISEAVTGKLKVI